MAHIVLTATIVVNAGSPDPNLPGNWTRMGNGEYVPNDETLEEYRRTCEDHLRHVLSAEDAFSGNGDTESITTSSVVIQ